MGRLRRRSKQLLDKPKELRVLEIEGGSTRSHCVESWLS
jgi:hypothetical protein